MAGIKWNRRALDQFDAFVRKIEQDSPSNAAKVRKSLLQKIVGLMPYPRRYPPDKFKIPNDGSYRAFECYKCRVSYQVAGNEIRIVRLRHTKMNPKTY